MSKQGGGKKHRM